MYQPSPRFANSSSAALDAYGYLYDAAGNRTSVERAATATVNYGYDDLGQLTRAAGYDPAGNLLLRTNNTLIQSFQTDNANELVNVTRDNNVLTVAGSVSNNVTGVAVNGQGAVIYHDLTYAVAGGVALANNVNQFTGVVSIGSVTLTNRLATELPVTVNLRHDANGNLLWDGLTAYTYDCANELAAATVTNCWKTTSAYDGFGRWRLRRECAWSSRAWAETNAVRYVYDGGTVLQERDSNNLPLVSYTRGVDLSGSLNGAGGIGGLLARTDASGSAFYHADGNGNLTALVNGSGTLAVKYLYDSFGNPLGMWGSLAAANTHRFSSKEMDLRSGLYYFGHRDYAPNLQRWLSRDPIGERGGINLYEYVANNPVNKIDSLGLDAGGRVGPGFPYDGYAHPELPSSPGSNDDSGVDLALTLAGAAATESLPSPEGIGSLATKSLRCVRGLQGVVAGALYEHMKQSINNLPKDPNHAFWVPFGFGFGTVNIYQPSEDNWLSLPAIIGPEGSSALIIFYVPPEFKQDLDNIVNRPDGLTPDLIRNLPRS